MQNKYYFCFNVSKYNYSIILIAYFYIMVLGIVDHTLSIAFIYIILSLHISLLKHV